MSNLEILTTLKRWFTILITLSSFVFLLAGCGLMQSSSEEESEPEGKVLLTIADLKMAPEVASTPDVEIKLDDVIARYSEAEKLISDPETKALVQYRKAHLLMRRSEQESTAELDEANSGSGSGSGSSFGSEAEAQRRMSAIVAYETLLRNYPDNQDNDQVLYQLAKSYELKGEQETALGLMDTLVSEYPQSNYYLESQFRRGEIYFSYGDYETSEQAFAEVMKGGKTSRFYRTASSMHGWSLFKREQFDDSLKSFITTLDDTIPPGTKYEDLPVASQTVVDDQLRVMSFAFSYLDGVDSLTNLFEEVGHRDYEYLVYQRVGEKLTEQERYTDTIKTYKRFINLYPLDVHSPKFQERVIHVTITSGLHGNIIPEKTLFVKQYGINSDFWIKFNGTSDIQFTKTRLKVYLDELSTYHHTVARKQLNKKQAIVSYEKASGYYQAYADTFPSDIKTNQMVFLLGESLYESGRYEQAIKAYETVAYAFIPDLVTGNGFSKGAEAGYAAILTYDKQLSKLTNDQSKLSNEQTKVANDEKRVWQQRQLASSLKFVEMYPQDSRAPKVQLRSIGFLYANESYEKAIIEAQKIVNWTPILSSDVRLDAWLIIANSQFKVQAYADAEQSFTEVSRLMSEKDKRYPEVVELLAASIYKQGEILASNGELRQAIEQFYRVGRIAPQSSMAISAEIDAASYLMQMEAWTEAISVLSRFRQQYPNDPFVKDIPLKLTYAYEKTEQWSLAARELFWMSRNGDNEERKRLALHQSAAYYLKAGDTTEAIRMYKRYAHQYEYPLDLAMEAQFTLSEMYHQRNELEKRRYWLKKIVHSYDSNESKGLTDDRMRYLAAMSSNVFAEEDFVSFTEIKLTLPLKKSLKKKKVALKRVLASYEKTAKYGVAEFTTSATYHIAQIYNQFSKDLFSSDRPKNLNELALEQYDILLEEQAYPFEEQAIEVHEINAQRSWNGIYDKWVIDSFNQLKTLYPSRYDKEETKVMFSDHIL